MDVKGRIALVTGANGFVGSAVCGRLLAEGLKVRALVRRPGESDPLHRKGIEEIGGDFTDPADAHGAVVGADLVVHCAAGLGSDLEDARRINVTGTHSITEAALTAGCARFVHISTTAIYETEAREFIDETTPFRTDGHAYGQSKAEGDSVVLAAVERGLPAVILRPSAILGVHPTSTWGVRVPGRIRTGQFPVVGDGSGRMPCLHIEGVLDAVMLAFGSDARVGRAYNLVDEHFTWGQYVEEVRRWFDAPEAPVTPVEQAPPGMYLKCTFRAERVREELGYRARVGYAEGMAEAERHWRGSAGS
jgi:nucleoside-diphosphate-sugar epimerase